ncbi:hypothetical protein [Amycolatopsis sp. NPDC051061]|uniref:hypothetical protein n=1 Tax=Amycolatopsis sp. NPDC051061 TaxID=3155042 RepID=UPI003432DECA
MRTEPLLLGVRVAVGPDGDAEELAEATRQVRRELHALDVEAVRTPAGGDAPAGSKGLELAASGALVVSVGRSQVLSSILAAVRTRPAGLQQRTVRLELDGDLLELTDEWLLRHGSRQ